MNHAFTLAVCLSLLVPGAVRADWPQFRGPQGNGVALAGRLPVKWNATTNVAWKTEIPGEGWASPVLSEGRLYVTAAVPGDAGSGSAAYSLRALCIDAVSGRIVWNQEVFPQPAGAPRIHTKNSHASPTPIVTSNRLFVHFGHQGTACLDLDGKTVWKNRDYDYEPVHGNGGSPVLVEDVLIFSCDGASDPFVVGLDADSGKEVWRFRRPGNPAKAFSFSTPAVIEVNGQSQVVSPGSEVVNALDPATGREIWRVHYDGYSVIPRPVFGHGLVFLSTGYNTPSVMAIRPDGRGDVTESHVAWTLKKGAPHAPSPLLVGDELYLISDKGIAACVDARTGAEHWTQRIGGNFSASPILADGKIYLQSEEGQATVLQPGKRLDILAETGFNERTLASYAVGKDALFIRTQRHLYRVQERQ